MPLNRVRWAAVCNAERNTCCQRELSGRDPRSHCVMYVCAVFKLFDGKTPSEKGSECQVGAVLLLRHSKWTEMLKPTAILDFQK